MPASLQDLFDGNRAWAARLEERQPGFFHELAKRQTPNYLWIGCSDSREPANQVLDLGPGEVFVHRNVANIINSTDMNAMSAIEFAVNVLKVEHILIVGHYSCGGVHAVMHDQHVGLTDNWLRSVRLLRQQHRKLLAAMPEAVRERGMAEINSIEQVRNTCETTIVQDAWARGQKLSVHSWCYDLEDGLVKNLDATVSAPEDAHDICDAALQRCPHHPTHG